MRNSNLHGPQTRAAHVRRRRLVITAALAVVVAALIGCGEGVQSPDSPGTTTQPFLVYVPPSGSGYHPLGDDASLAPTTTVTIPAQTGGQIVSGRHTLTFAPGALAQDTEITLVDATVKNGFVSAECYPAGLQFHALVTLESDVSDIVNPTGYDIYWLVSTPGGITYVNMDGQVSPSGKGVITTLTHFSDYAPGKAGW